MCSEHETRSPVLYRYSGSLNRYVKVDSIVKDEVNFLHAAALI